MTRPLEVITYVEDLKSSEVVPDDANMLRIQDAAISQVTEKNMRLLFTRQPSSLPRGPGGESCTSLPALSRSSSRSSICTLPTPNIDLVSCPSSHTEVRLATSPHSLLLSYQHELREMDSHKASDDIAILSEKPDRSAGHAKDSNLPPHSPSVRSETGTTESPDTANLFNVRRHPRSVQSFADFRTSLPEKQHKARQARSYAATGSASRAYPGYFNPFDEAFATTVNFADNKRTGQRSSQGHSRDLSDFTDQPHDKSTAMDQKSPALSPVQSRASRLVAFLKPKRARGSVVFGPAKSNKK